MPFIVFLEDNLGLVLFVLLFVILPITTSDLILETVRVSVIRLLYKFKYLYFYNFLVLYTDWVVTIDSVCGLRSFKRYLGTIAFVCLEVAQPFRYLAPCFFWGPTCNNERSMWAGMSVIKLLAFEGSFSATVCCLLCAC